MDDKERELRGTGRRLRFGLFSLMLVMFVFCVMGAAGRFLIRAMQSGTSPKAVFVIFTLASPMLLVVVLSLARVALRRWGRRR